MDKNLFAYTANAHPYPEYVSLNERGPFELLLTVREPAKPGPNSDKDCGATATATIPVERLDGLIDALIKVRSEWHDVRYNS